MIKESDFHVVSNRLRVIKPSAYVILFRLKVRRRRREKLQVVRPRLKRTRAETVWRRERSGAPARRRSATEIVTVAEVETARSGVSETVRVGTGRSGRV